MSLQRNKANRSWRGGDQFSFRKSQSYTDINNQISGYNANLRWDEQQNCHTIDLRNVKKRTPKSKVDYAFLREILGIKTQQMGTRKRSSNERFLSEELREAVLKLRREVKDLKLEIKDTNWLKTLEDLGDLHDLDKDFLEALYMLRNAYKKGVFSSTQSIQDLDLGQMLEGFPFGQEWEQNQPLFTAMSYKYRSHSPTSTMSRVSSDYSSDVESTTSSAIRKRPAKPQIHLSSASFSDLAAKEDDILIFKAGDPILTSEKLHLPIKDNEVKELNADRTPERPDSADSSSSYLNLVEENVASKYLSVDNGDLSPNSQSSKKSDFKENCDIESKQSDLRVYETFRSDSPTSKLLEPFFSSPMTEDVFKVLEKVRATVSPKISRMQTLENENKLIAVLQVKLAVLQEEKRQLLNTLKQKRSIRQSLSSNQSSKASSPQSSPVSFQSEGDDVFVIRPSPHRSRTNKTTQTACEKTETALSCPICGRKDIKKQTDEATKIVAEGRIGNLNKNRADSVPGKAEDEIHRNEAYKKVKTCHAETSTISAKFIDAGVGDANIFGNRSDASTETVAKKVADFAVGNGIAELSFSDVSTQDSTDLTDVSSQYDEVISESKSILVGCPSCDFATVAVQCSPSLKDSCFGDAVVDKECVDSLVQHSVLVLDKAVESVIPTNENYSMCGCAFTDLISVSSQASVSRNDFMCGDGVAVQKTVAISCQTAVEMRDSGTSPMGCGTREKGTQHDLGRKEVRSFGVGEGKTQDIVCDNCLNKQYASIGVGGYNEADANFKAIGFGSDKLCRIDDKLCECIKPHTNEIAIGESSVHNIVCDVCVNRKYDTKASGDGRIDDLLCDICENRHLVSRGCGDDEVTTLLCDECKQKGESQDIGVGDGDVLEVLCDKCENVNNTSGFVNVSILEGDAESAISTVVQTNGHGDTRKLSDVNENEVSLNERQRILSGSSEEDFCEEVSKIMANSTLSTQIEQKPVICNYCGNKVDLNDENLDSALSTMRSNLGAYKRNGTEAAGFNLENFNEHSNIEGAEDEMAANGGMLSDASDDEEEDISESFKNDIVESCKMLQMHLSGEKPLKHQLMLKYLANIEALWFQTVKKKRANAAVVKSYIDLFRSRVPDLLDTIINLMDQDGNTALHFALTYKNTGVVSILLDSHECKVDIVNKAGYSPIMLSALAGFDSKTDKYVMQRLLRAGDINAKNRETGQTPLMFAVSRGHVGMVDLLLDAGADVNETDDDGSTALMCACENGSMSLVKALLSNPDCDSTKEDHEGSTALSIAMDAKRRDLALLIYGSLNFDARGRIKLTPSKQSLLGLGTRRSPSPAVGKI